MAGRPIYTTMLNIKIACLDVSFHVKNVQACIDQHPFIIFYSFQLYIIKKKGK
jgi:hypothetical protein